MGSSSLFGILALISGTFQINALWNYGPYDPSPVQAGAQPDWYIGPFEGVLRLMPGYLGDFSLEWVIPTPWGGNSLALPVLVPMIPVGIMFLGLFVWPWIEAWITGDRKERHLLDRPRNAPTRTAFGVAVMTFYMVMWGMGSNDLIATHFGLSLNDITYWSRVLIFVGPVIAYLLTKRICLALQRKDRETALHGHEAGVIEVTPDGGFHEKHLRLSDHEMWTLTSYEAPLPSGPRPNAKGKVTAVEKLRAGLNRIWFEDRVAPVSRDEYQEALEHDHHHDDGGLEAAESTQGSITRGH